MLRIGALTALIVLRLVPAANSTETVDLLDCRSGKVTALHRSKELTLLSAECKGIVRAQNGNKDWDNATLMCVGVIRRQGKDGASNGLCKWQDTKGDLAFLEWVATGPAGGTWKFLGGTGQWKDVSGGGEFKYLGRSKPIEPGTFQSCIHDQGTYTKAM